MIYTEICCKHAFILMLNSYLMPSTVGIKYRFDASMYGDESVKLVGMVGGTSIKR